ncbi:MAG: hypothetical protein GX943_00085 [Candidatus Pacebacteria bacterium]|nr:hypothetical protein [Candidatus Paceibacterota bacterium]
MPEQSKTVPDKNKSAEAKKEASTASQELNLPKSVDLEKSKVAPGYYRPIPEETLVTWEAPARPFKKRNKQFFSTIFIIAILVALILFFAGQVLPVALVISVVFLVYVTAMIPPHNVSVKLTNYGFYVDKDAYAWYEMGRFWFEKKQGFDTLQIELGRFPNRLSLVLIDGVNPSKENLELVLSEVLLKEKPKPTAFEKVSIWLSEKIPLE